MWIHYLPPFPLEPCLLMSSPLCMLCYSSSYLLGFAVMCFNQPVTHLWTVMINDFFSLSINQSIKFYLYSPYSQTTVRLIGLFMLSLIYNYYSSIELCSFNCSACFLLKASWTCLERLEWVNRITSAQIVSGKVQCVTCGQAFTNKYHQLKGKKRGKETFSPDSLNEPLYYHEGKTLWTQTHVVLKAEWDAQQC